jgi:hypothetical protein
MSTPFKFSILIHMKSSVGVKLFEYNFDDKNIVFGPYLACYVPLRNQGSFRAVLALLLGNQLGLLGLLPPPRPQIN